MKLLIMELSTTYEHGSRIIQYKAGIELKISCKLRGGYDSFGKLN
jgi:hypothetical protein